MPTYEYRCPDGHKFEKFFRSIGAGAVEVACPTCGLIAERRMSAGAGLLFKGSGFYLTDYGKNAHRTGAATAPAASSGDGGASGEGSAAAKSDAAAPAGDGGSAKGESAPAPSAAAAPKAAESKPAPAKSTGGDA